MANNFLSGGLLGWGGLGGSQPAYSSLLGDLYDPKEARKAQMKQMLIGMGMGLMSEKGFGRGAELALAMGSRANEDYRQSALDAYRLKRDALADERWEKEYGLRQKDAAWQATERQRQLDEWQRADDIRTGQVDQVTGFMDRVDDYTQQGGDLFDPGMQSWLRGQGIEGVDPMAPRVTAQDRQRYNKMQPHVGAKDYGGAFQQMTAEPAIPDPFTLGEDQIRYDGYGNPIAAGPAGQPKLTDDQREYEQAVQQGYRGTIQQYMIEMKKAGATNIDNRQMGTIPPGYRVEYDERGQPVQLIPIPGGPAAADAEKADSAAAAQQNKRMTLTDTVVTAADTARALADGTSTGLIGQGMSFWGEADAAEVYRQVEVLKANAKIENLTAMRRESPTGAALGSVTEKENEMLAAAAGALDPSAGSKRFQQQLDNYELTLMRVIHGYNAGTQMFMQRKAAQQQSPQPQSGGGTEEWSFDENGNPVRVR